MAQIYNLDGKQMYKDCAVTDELLKRKYNAPNTPDFLELKQKKHYVIFAYGSLRLGGRFHKYIEDCPYLGKAWTAANTFQVVESPLKTSIGFRISPTNISAARVLGEAYVVSAKKIMELDSLFENLVAFQRSKVSIFLKDQEYKTVNGNAKASVSSRMYLGDKDFWEGVYTTDTVKLKRGHTGKLWYYDYDPLDDILNLPERKDTLPAVINQ